MASPLTRQNSAIFDDESSDDAFHGARFQEKCFTMIVWMMARLMLNCPMMIVR